MRKTISVLLISFGLLFGAVSIWSVKNLLTEDRSEKVIIEDCSRRLEMGMIRGRGAMDVCIERGRKTMSKVVPTYATVISIFGILSVLFLTFGGILFRKKKSQP